MEHFLLRRRHFHLWGWIKPRIRTSVITCKLVITETKNTCQGFASSRYHRRQRKCNGYAADQLEGGRWGQTFQCATHNNSVAETSPTLEEIGTSWNHPRCGRHRGKHTATGLSYSPQIPMGLVETTNHNRCRNTTSLHLNIHTDRCVIVSGEFHRAPSWIGSGVVQGSTGWRTALIDVPVNWEQDCFIDESRLCLFHADGRSRCGIAEVNVIPTIKGT